MVSTVVELERRDDVFVLRMTAGDNRFNPTFLRDMHAALDDVERTEGPVALVTTGEGKFYSNGLDLEWLMGEGAAQLATFPVQVHRLLGRLLAFPVPTVAALNGHTFAAGAMLSLAHDVRVMRGDRGFWCLPEADIKIPFTPAMSALIQAKLTPAVAHRAMVFAQRYGGADALAAGIVDASVAEDAVLEAAVGLARELAGKDRGTVAAIKRGLYGRALDLLEADEAAVTFGEGAVPV